MPTLSLPLHFDSFSWAQAEIFVFGLCDQSVLQRNKSHVLLFERKKTKKKDIHHDGSGCPECSVYPNYAMLSTALDKRAIFLETVFL